MIRFIYAEDLQRNHVLQRTMFLDRAVQFRERLNWDVTVDKNGYERDQYDKLNPMYIIFELKDGTHGGSVRIMPTVGKTMLNDYFKHINNGFELRSPLMWECTRFCISPRISENRLETLSVSAALMMAGCEMGMRFGLAHAVGVFDKRMIRIYRGIGWPPQVIGTEGSGIDSISIGLWPIDRMSLEKISRKSGISLRQAAEWFDQSFGMREAMDDSLVEIERAA